MKNEGEKKIRKKESQSVPFCEGADTQLLDIVWACLLSFRAGLCWSQGFERSFNFSEGYTSFGWENKSFEQNFMITLLVMLGPNYKCNLCIGNPLEISIKFDICVLSILSYESWFLGQILPSLFMHSKRRLSYCILQSLILFFQSIAASRRKKKKDKAYSKSSSYFSIAFHLVHDLQSYLQVIMLVMFIGKINL